MPVKGREVPSAGPLHEDFQVLPSASTMVSVHLADFSVSVTMTKTSLFMEGPPPKSDSARLRVHVLGTGRWVWAAKAKGVSADERIITATRRVNRNMGSPCESEDV